MRGFRSFWGCFFMFFLIEYSLSQKSLNFAVFQPIYSAGNLVNSFSSTSCGLNYVSESVLLCKNPQSQPFKGLDQPAVINISGLPASAKIDKAFLWWDISGKDTSGRVIISNPLFVTDTFTALKLAAVYDPCQDNDKTTFRADVTGIINGNGKYMISGLPSDSIGLGTADTDGATLFIIYKDSTASFTGTLAIYDGAVMAGNTTVTQSISSLNITANTTGKAFMIVSDMENKTGNAIKLNNGTYAGFAQNFWDYQEKTTAFSSGQISSTFGVQMPNDCGNFLLMGIYYQTAVTPVTPVITQKADTLISSTASAYFWKYNGNFISSALFKAYLAHQSGNYQVITMQNGSNCYFPSSLYNLITCSDKMKPNINKSGKILSTDSVRFPIQWFVDGDLDSGRTSNIDTARITANYWVQVNDPLTGCIVNSDTVYISLIGINEKGPGIGFVEVFPNPSAGMIYLKLHTASAKKVDLVIENISGQKLLDHPLDCKTKDCEYSFDLSGFSDGVYLLKLVGELNTVTRKIYIQNN
ncbi:MAG: T9SS type A sorting domain-containing protein [Bacteroidia bacterium]|nr:T9SS type A sorting domain-containing protein [Bacteroidia bacterium]